MKINIQEALCSALPKLNLILAFNIIVLLTCLWGVLSQPHRSFALDARLNALPEDAGKHEALNKVGAGTNENMFLQHLLCGNTMRMVGTPDNPSFELVGFIRVQDKRAAMLKDKKTGKSYYCLGGEEINGMKVKEIQDRKVILEADGMQVEITK